MAQTFIPKPGPNAFMGGALDNKWLGGLVDLVNTPMEVKMDEGQGKVIYSKEKIVIDLKIKDNAVDGVARFWVVVNGGLAQYDFKAKQVV